MATYVVLSNFTEQGIRGIKNTVQRADQVAEMAKEFGCEMREVYWTLGAFDIVAIVDAPSEQNLMAFGFALGASGNIRTQTLRAFTKSDVGTIIGRLP